MLDGRVGMEGTEEEESERAGQGYAAGEYWMKAGNRRIPHGMKQIWGVRLTTVFVRQGHYALDPKPRAQYPAADLSINRIGDLPNHDLAALCAAAGPKSQVGGQIG